jgi:hypothetical protein
MQATKVEHILYRLCIKRENFQSKLEQFLHVFKDDGVKFYQKIYGITKKVDFLLINERLLIDAIIFL